MNAAAEDGSDVVFVDSWPGVGSTITPCTDAPHVHLRSDGRCVRNTGHDLCDGAS